MNPASPNLDKTDLQHSDSLKNLAEKNVTKVARVNSDFSEIIKILDKYSLEDIIEIKLARFFGQISEFFPENLHNIMIQKVEKPLLSHVLKKTGGNQVHTAQILGINRNTLRKKIKLYNL
ncbi:MAG: hypothetical protein KBD78_17075 [Oligoflexales bacterium]|nr:hypothetical protein [Oligoflexales bacterium]